MTISANINVPVAKIVKDGKKWGVKVKWPKTGPWFRNLIFPRYVWHGPFGINDKRWDNFEGAAEFVKSFERDVSRMLGKHE